MVLSFQDIVDEIIVPLAAYLSNLQLTSTFCLLMLYPQQLIRDCNFPLLLRESRTSSILYSSSFSTLTGCGDSCYHSKIVDSLYASKRETWKTRYTFIEAANSNQYVSRLISS